METYRARCRTCARVRWQALATGTCKKDFRGRGDEAQTVCLTCISNDIIDDWVGVSAADVIQALLSFARE